MKKAIFLSYILLFFKNIQSHSLCYAPLCFLQNASYRIKNIGFFSMQKIPYSWLGALNLKNIQLHSLCYALSYFSTFALLKAKILATWLGTLNLKNTSFNY